jgi:TPR repeat protein
LHTGRGIPVDFIVASEFFKRAADSKNVDAMNIFGRCLERGQGVHPNIDKAILYD